MKKILFTLVTLLGFALNVGAMTISDAPDITTSRSLTGAEQLPIAVKNVNLPYSITLNEISSFTLNDTIIFKADTSLVPSVRYTDLGTSYIVGLRITGATYFGHPYGPFIYLADGETFGDETLKIDSSGAITTKGWVDAQFIKLKSASMVCGSSSAGAINYVAGDAGVKDSVRVCAKDATNTYAWRTIY